MEKICWQAVKGILWSNVKEYFDEITVDISKQYNVFNIKDINMPYESFIQAVRGVYQIDSIADWKVETKIKHMQGEEPYIVRTFDIDMENPEFRVKTEGTTLSKKGELLKNLVRTKYKKVLSDYFPDIIFHTADNFKQSEYLDAMFCDAFSLEPLFDKIKDYKWIMIKEESNYIPNDFPKSFPLYKDIDLFCVKEDRECVEKCIQEFLETYTRGIYTWRRVSKNINNSFYRFEVQGFLLFGIDLWCADKYLKDNFIKRSIENRIEKNGYYVPQIRDEVIYRLAEFCQHPDKIRHLDFVKQNRKYLDKDYGLIISLCEITNRLKAA